MTQTNRNDKHDTGLSRRRFLELSAVGSAAIAAGSTATAQKPKRPNFLFIITDQQALDTLSAYGCKDLHTPHLDRLAARGYSFMESHSTNPVCSPARSSMFTGRMPSETGVIKNGLPIRKDMPNMGQWLGDKGYDPVYVGKWHLPGSYTRNILGFTVLPAGNNGHGSLLDRTVSRVCQGFLHQRKSADPFLLVASFLQPHDICQWSSSHKKSPTEIPYPQIIDELPPLPDNFEFDEHEPTNVKNQRRYAGADWTETQWRYYIWAYYRMVEEVDAEVGRVLQALEDSGLDDNTIVVFTSDHGEGRGRHQMIVKNYLYEEALKVPLIFSCPGRVEQGVKDDQRLVSGVDIMATVCDYAGVKPPQGITGGNLRPVIEGRPVEWRDYAMAEVKQIGRALRTPDYKYIAFNNDPVEQLFDMKADPGETKNLAVETKYADTLKEHEKMLSELRAKLDLAPNAEKMG